MSWGWFKKKEEKSLRVKLRLDEGDLIELLKGKELVKSSVGGDHVHLLLADIGFDRIDYAVSQAYRDYLKSHRGNFLKVEGKG
jgi:hypothetical protein